MYRIIKDLGNLYTLKITTIMITVSVAAINQLLIYSRNTDKSDFFLSNFNRNTSSLINKINSEYM